MLRRARVPVPLPDAELRVLVQPKLSPTEMEVWGDPAYADTPTNVAPPTSAVLATPFLLAGYGLLCGAAFLLRLAKRGLRGLNRKADEADRKVTVFGLVFLLAMMFAARYGVYALAAMGGAQ